MRRGHSGTARQLAGRFARAAQPWTVLDALWTRILGEPGPDRLAFEKLERRLGNSALACPPDLGGRAKADRDSPVFAIPASKLKEIVGRVAQSEPRTVLVSDQTSSDHARYVVRSALLRFPDLVDIRIIARDDFASTLAIYSRSRVGRRDFGVNRRRIERWIARIDRAIASEG